MKEWMIGTLAGFMLLNGIVLGSNVQAQAPQGEAEEQKYLLNPLSGADGPL